MAYEHSKPKEPQGAAAHLRIIDAIRNMREQFLICGLEPPTSITVKPGQKKWIEAIIRGSGMLLFDDNRAAERGKTTIWDTEIKEDQA